MQTVSVTRLDIDTHVGDKPNYGRVTVKIGDRSVVLQLDQAQIDGLASIAAGYAAEIMAAIYNEKQAA